MKYRSQPFGEELVWQREHPSGMLEVQQRGQTRGQRPRKTRRQEGKGYRGVIKALQGLVRTQPSI